MIYMPSRYRYAEHIGGVRIRLAKSIVDALTEAGFKVVCEPKNLHPALGYWKHNRADVKRWEGVLSIWRHGKMSDVAVSSWDSMTDCLKGFRIDSGGFFDFEVSATDGARSEGGLKYYSNIEPDEYSINPDRHAAGHALFGTIVMGKYQKGDLDIASAAYADAKEKYDRAERALAVARRELTQAERHRSETFRALVDKTVAEQDRP